MTANDSTRCASDPASPGCGADNRNEACVPPRTGWLDDVSAALGRMSVFARVLLILAASVLLWVGIPFAVLAVLG